MSITIGSDPEFGLMDQYGEQVFAHRHLPNSTSAPIGVDGHSHIGELRPKHGETPREHLSEIAHLMAQVSQTVPDRIRITAGSMVGEDAIGGHIHFGVNKRTFATPTAIRALDYYLALPVALIEVQGSAKRRRTLSSYGSLGAHRDQLWGFEYRTLPSWLLGWGVTLSILSIGYAIVDAVHQKSYPDVPWHIPNPDHFDNCNKKELKPLLGKIRKGWRELPLYPKMRLEFAYLNHLLVQGMEWKEGDDIRSSWWAQRGKRASKFQVYGNPKDQGCPEIAELVTGIKGTRIFIYGLKPSREAQIALSNLDMMSGLTIDYPVEVTRYGISQEYDGWLCIGLSLELRQDVQAASNLINRILKTETEADRAIEQHRIPGTRGYRGPSGRFQSRQQMLGDR